MGAASTTLIVLTALAATQRRRDPVHCPEGQTPLGPRCCGLGQRLERGSCVGTPRMCGPHLDLASGPHPGCVAKPRRILVPGATLIVGPIDWEAQGVVERRETRVAAFYLDEVEVTRERWDPCVVAGSCPAVAGLEPGLPVTEVSPDSASAFCKFAGGRLPSGDEWMLAAMGPESQRYPWGNSGLVCRRAAFGLVHGPCANEGAGPDVAGNRPEGATPQGIQDLAGNVAEWTREPGGEFLARGGSFRSRRAAELKGWAYEAGSAPMPHIGFRCAYDE